MCSSSSHFHKVAFSFSFSLSYDGVPVGGVRGSGQRAERRIVNPVEKTGVFNRQRQKNKDAKGGGGTLGELSVLTDTRANSTDGGSSIQRKEKAKKI